MKITKRYKHGRVYAICNASGHAVYVGATRTTVGARFKFHRAHARAGRTTPIAEWLRRNMGEASARVLMDEVPVAELDAAEHRFIEVYRAAGAKLLNVQVVFYDKSPDF